MTHVARYAALFVPCLLLRCSSSPSPASPTDSGGASDTGAASLDGGDAAEAAPGAAAFAQLAGCATPPSAGAFPSDVQAVLQDKCWPCHQMPPKNHAPFPLLTYADVL